MSNKKASAKLLKRRICYYLTSGIITITMPMAVYSAEQTKEQAPMKAEFDSVFLMGDAQKVDISRFKYGNPILPGEYSVDVYINGNWFGKKRMVFRSTEQNQNAYTCFTANSLLEYGVKQEVLVNRTETSAPSACYKIEEWVENAYYDFDTSRLRIDVSIPQIALQKNAQGYVDPSVWDRGINAGFLSYNGSTYKTFHKSSDQQETTNAFIGLTTGANIGGWQFRHNGQWQWQDNKESEKKGSNYEAVSSYAQRAFPNYRGVLTLGDSFTNGEIFDSFGYRGVDFSSDDRMLPNSMIGYAPQIRGNAKTNAKVEIRQQGQLIYQTTVAPGRFEINDLYPTGFGGELEVSVIESNGEIQKFAVPYASVVQMLRPGLSRYSLTAGEFRDRDIDLTPWVTQGKYQRGINNYLTAYTGFQLAEDYGSALVGAAFATPIGAISLDVTHSQADFKKQESQSGQSFRLSYSKLIAPTDTNLTLAAYRYSTENYYNLRDAILIRDLEEKGENTYAVGKQRSEFQITLNQGLPEGWGNVYVVGSWIDYWNRSESTKQYQIGYSNNYQGITYGISAVNRQIEYGSNRSDQDTEYLATISFPLSFKKNSANVNTTIADNNRTVGVSGVVGDRFSYGASMSHQDRNDPSFNVNSRYRTNFATVGGSYSYAEDYQQAMLSLSGSIVAHSQGVLFGPDQGQTMVLVYAPDAAGAKVGNTVGLSINKAGYAVIPYVTPYRLNDITLDPQNMSTNVELEETSQRIAPFAGAIAKVDFSTKTGYAIYIQSKQANGESLPFATQVYNKDKEAVGMVAQGSLIYVRTKLPQDTLYVNWGDEASEQCQVSYDVRSQLDKDQQNMIMTEAICK